MKDKPIISLGIKTARYIRYFISKINLDVVRARLYHLYVPFLFLLIVLLFFHSRERFEFDTDEGINLIKALLVEKGYPLYSQVWSDQPPFLTYLLALGIHFFGYKVEVARNIIMLMSLGLLWAAFELIHVTWKRSYAFVACLLIFLLPEYLVLSVSVMVGLPSISLAMISLFFLALWHQKSSYFWLILSATVMGLAVLTKLMIAFLAPIIMFGILVADFARFRDDRDWRGFLTSVAIWLTTFGAIFIGTLIIVVEPSNLSQLVENHLDMAQILYYENPEFTINYHLGKSWPILFLAILGTIFVIKMRRWFFLYLTAWLITAYTLLFFHQPVWYHHQIYVTVPAAMLAGIAVVEGFDLCVQIIRRRFRLDKMVWVKGGALMGTIFVVISFIQAPETLNYLNWPPSLKTTGLEIGGKTEKIYLRMHEYATQTRWVITDLPMFAFRVGLPVPPEIAVFTEKRMFTDHLTETQILAALIEYQPEQVMLGKFILPELEDYLNTNYNLILSNDRLKLYIRNDLLE